MLLLPLIWCFNYLIVWFNYLTVCATAMRPDSVDAIGDNWKQRTVQLSKYTYTEQRIIAQLSSVNNIYTWTEQRKIAELSCEDQKSRYTKKIGKWSDLLLFPSRFKLNHKISCCTDSCDSGCVPLAINCTESLTSPSNCPCYRCLPCVMKPITIEHDMRKWQISVRTF